MSEYLWVEKYRPKKISECILSEDIKKTFAEFLKQKEIPNLLLSGTQGTGKTTVARALCEELGATYSPQAHASASMVFDYGNLMAMSIGAPEDVEKVTGLIHEMGLQLGSEGVTQDELDRALKPILSNLEKTLRDNGYWLNTVMAQSQSEPYRLDWARERDADYASITLEEINALAKKHLAKANAAQMAILPEKAPAQ